MAKLVLELETNGFEAFNKVNQSMTDLNNGVDKFEKNSKESFAAVGKETDNLNQKIKTTATESVNASNKIINGANKEKVAIQLLKQQIAEVVAYEKQLQAQRDKTAPGKGQLEYNKKIAEVRLDLKGMQKDLVELEAAEKALLPPVVSLKKELKDLKAQIAITTDPAEYQRLVQKAGELEDKIGDTSAAVRAFASDSKASQAKTLFGQIGNDLANLDFKDAAEKATQLKNVVKTFNFSEMIAGAKSAVTTIYQVGAALFSLPIVWVLAGIASVVVAFKFMSDSAEESSASQRESLNKLAERYDKMYDVQIALAEALGKKTDEIELGKLKTKEEAINRELDMLRKRSEDLLGLSDEEEARYTELMNLQTDIANEIIKVKTKALKKEIEEEQKKEEKSKAIRDKALADAKKHAEDLAAALLSLAREADAAFTDMLSGRERLDAQLNTANASVKILEDELLKKKRLAGKAAELTASEQLQFDTLRLRNAQTYSDGIIAIAVENANLLVSQEEKKTKSALEQFNLRQQILINAVNATKRPNGVSDVDFELQKQKAILNIQKNGHDESIQLQIDEINKAAAVQIEGKNGELLIIKDKTDQISNVKRIGLEADIAMITAKTPVEIEAIKTKMAAELAAINKGLIDNAKAYEKHPPIDWAKILGVSKEDAALILQGVDDILAQSQSLVDQQMAMQQKGFDGELSIIQKRKDARDNELRDLQSKLDDELKLREDGLANNVDSVMREIEAKEAGRQKDIEAERRIQAEKKKLAKQQLIIDTALQASQMVTAVAKTINAYAYIPGGAIIAAALVALEISTFIAAKAQAFKAINQQTNVGFKKGGYTGDVSVDAEVGVVHGQEFVNTASDTKKYRSLFEGIHTKDNKMMEIGVRDLIKGTGISLTKDTPKELSNMKSEARTNEINILAPKRDSSNDARMESIEKDVKQVAKESSKRRYTNEKGDLVIENGRNKTVIRKK